jgi:hypothetical protein
MLLRVVSWNCGERCENIASVVQTGDVVLLNDTPFDLPSVAGYDCIVTRSWEKTSSCSPVAIYWNVHKLSRVRNIDKHISDTPDMPGRPGWCRHASCGFLGAVLLMPTDTSERERSCIWFCVGTLPPISFNTANIVSAAILPSVLHSCIKSDASMVLVLNNSDNEEATELITAARFMPLRNLSLVQQKKKQGETIFATQAISLASKGLSSSLVFTSDSCLQQPTLFCIKTIV